MRKAAFVLFMLAALIGTLLTGCDSWLGDTDRSLDNVKASGVFVVAIDDNAPPMAFRDEKGELTGVAVDFAEEAAKRMGAKVEFKPMKKDDAVDSLTKGYIDAIWGDLTSADKIKGVSFTNPYLLEKPIIVTQRNSGIKVKADLAGKVIGVQAGEIEEALNKNKSVVRSAKEVKPYPDYISVLADLAERRIDAAVVDEVDGRYYIARKFSNYNYNFLDINLNQGKQYVVGLRKEDKALLKELNRILDEMEADGMASRISKRWFDEDIILRR